MRGASRHYQVRPRRSLISLPPKSVSEIRRFLGMTNYYRQCVPDYAKVAEPIVRLTRKSEDFEWGPAQGHAFGNLKALLVSPAVMAHPDAFAPYRLYTDACDYAIGGILCQMDTNGVERVIQYISHQLNPVQRRKRSPSSTPFRNSDRTCWGLSLPYTLTISR